MSNLWKRAAHQVERVRAEINLADRRGGGPRVLFFPSEGPIGASLLRAYNVAPELERRGWIAGVVPASVKLSGRKRIIGRFHPDILVFQQCRHPLNDGDLSFGVPYVVDTDDADFDLPLAGLPERLERTVRQAKGVIAGSAYLRAHHRKSNPNVAVIWTGSPKLPSHSPTDHNGRRPIVAWAQAKPLDYKQELEFVAELDQRLRSGGSEHIMRFHGVDTVADREAMSARFPGAQLLPTMNYAKFVQSLDDVAVGLCPLIPTSKFSRGKSFGKILAYLEAGVPIVASDVADHGQFFTPKSGCVSNDPDEWERTILNWLSDPELRNAVARNAAALQREKLSLDAVGRQTDEFLRSLL